MEFSCFCFFNCFTEASFELQLLRESKSRDANLLLAVGRAFHTIFASSLIGEKSQTLIKMIFHDLIRLLVHSI